MAEVISEIPKAFPGPSEHRVGDSERDERLFEAARNGEYLDVIKTVEAGASVDAISEDFGETPLHVAAGYGNADAVRALLEKGAINGRDKDGWTPLYAASRAGHISVVKLLLSPSSPLPDKEARTSDVSKMPGKRVGTISERRYEVQVDSADYENLTPLHVASLWGEADVVRAIVTFKLNLENDNPDKNLDKPDKFGRSALYIAVQEGYSAVVRQLRDADASWKVQDESALFAASRSGDAEVVQALLEMGADVTVKNHNANDENPLHVAAINGHTEVVARLLTLGYERRHVHFRDRAERDDIGLLRALVKIPDREKVQKAVFASNQDGDTALHLAASVGHHETVEKLLEIFDQEAADLRNKAGKTALHVASEGGFATVVRCLLSKARIGTPISNGDSALHIASSKGHTEVVKVLLSAKSVSNVIALKNQKGETPLGMAIQSQRWSISETILNVIFNSKNKTADLGRLDFEEALISAARQSESHNVVQLLLMTTTHDERMKRCADVQSGRTDSTRGWTALHWAAYHGRWEVVWWLLHKSSWTTREMRAAYATGEIGLQELKGIGEHKSPEPRTPLTYLEIEELMQKPTKLAEMSRSNKQREQVYTADNQETKEREERERYYRSLDMLKDPPLFESQDSGKTYDMPEPMTDPEGILDNYYATIVDFYPHGDRSDLLRRSRTVREIIYSKGGPDEIMEHARETLGEVDKDAAKEKHFVKENLRFRWIHLPANNMDWMTDLAQRIYMDRSRLEKEFRNLEDFIWGSWYELPEGPSPRHYMRPGCKTETVNETLLKQMPGKRRKKIKRNDSRTPEQIQQNPFSKVALYVSTRSCGKTLEFDRMAKMPYVTFAVYTPEDKKETRSFEPFNEALQTNAHDCDPLLSHDLRSFDDLDAGRYRNLLTLYEGKIIHRSRTLDESYYDFLVDMKERNEDQVVSKYLSGHRGDHHHFEQVFGMNRSQTIQRENNSKAGEGKGQNDTMKILRVDQLWLWVIDEKTIITSSTHRQDHADDPVLEKTFAYLREENSKKTGRKPLPLTVNDMSFFIPKFCVGFMNYCNWKDEFDIHESVSQIFANSINQQADRELKLFKDFTKKMASIVEDLEKKDDDRETMVADNKMNEREAKREKFGSDRSTTADEKRTFKSIGRAATQLLQIKDIRDELNMLKAIGTQQKKVWDELLRKAPKNDDSRSAADYTIENIQEMDGVASRVQQAILAVMNLEQSEASINEAVSARRQTNETIEQGRTLMVFTVITIIFLPLSFLASLFALNITSFPHTPGDAQPGSLQYKVGWLFPILFAFPQLIALSLVGVTAGIFVIAVAIAFYGPLSRFWHSRRKTWKKRTSFHGSGGFNRKSSTSKKADDVGSLSSNDSEFPLLLERSSSLPLLSFRDFEGKSVNEKSSRLRSRCFEVGQGTDGEVSAEYRYRRNGPRFSHQHSFPNDVAEGHRSLVRRVSSLLKPRGDGQRGPRGKGIV